jgi:hypothetical protein
VKNSLSISGFSDICDRLIGENRIDEAIEFIRNVAHETLISGRFKGTHIRIPELDRKIVDIAKLLTPRFASPNQVSNEHVCLVTEIYQTGGHRQILNSVAEEIPCHVIFSDLLDRIALGKTKLQGLVTPKALSSLTINSGDLLSKVITIVNLLNSISPKRVWILNHHQDVVILIAALIFDNGRRSIFVHHCDHDPGLGATIDFPVHLDLTDELLDNCVSIDLKASRLALYGAPASRRAHFATSPLVIATAGSMNKFKGTMMGIQYPEVVSTILMHPAVGTFHHIGEVRDDYVSEFRNYLSSCGIDPNRMQFAGQVPRVSDHLLSIGARAYLSSFPLGAGTTTAEVQSAAIPVMYFNSKQKQMPLCSGASVFASPELEWNLLEDIHPILDMLTNDWNTFSNESYKKYTESSSRQVFLRQLETLR